MPGLRGPARRPCRRPRLRAVLAGGGPGDASLLRQVRRCAAGLAGQRPPVWSLRTLPPPADRPRPRARRRPVRRRPPADPACAQVRRATDIGRPPRCPDEAAGPGRSGGRRLRGAGAPALAAPPRTGLQPGGGPRGGAGPARCPRTAPRAGHRAPVRPERTAAAPERPGGVRTAASGTAEAAAARSAAAGRVRGAGRRCVHDGRHARGVCGGAQGGWRARGAGAYGSASLVCAARVTSAATSSIGRSPSIATQPGAAAWRR